jgi:hydroxypyruvate isomerase
MSTSSPHAAASRPRRFSAHLGYLFSERPLQERFGAAKQAGFAGVEHPNPYSVPAAEMRRWLDDLGLPFVQMGMPSGDPAKGEKGFAALPERIEPFRSDVHRALDYAEGIGCRMVHAMAGVCPARTSRDRLWPTYVENIVYAAEAAAGRSVTILLEPIGAASVADYFLNDPALGVRALEEVARSNVRLLFDVFHTVNDGADPVAFIRRHGASIAHVHIADHPGRHEPLTGTIDFAAAYAALDGQGYGGFIGCEYIPAGRTDEGLSWLRDPVCGL